MTDLLNWEGNLIVTVACAAAFEARSLLSVMFRALGPLLAILALASAGTSRNQRLLSHFETNLALEQAFYDSISGTEVCITNRTEKTLLMRMMDVIVHSSDRRRSVSS